MTRSEMQNSDREDVAAFVERHWHSKLCMSRGRSHYPHKEEGFLERREGQLVGLLTYCIDGDEMELLTLNSTLPGQGIGSALMLQAIEAARQRRCRRICLATTNDNLRAIGFYQRLGFRMVAVNVGVVDKAREIKPQIPEIGERGIPIHDEIIMELRIKPYLESEPPR